MATTNTLSRDQADTSLKVICLGLSRTGTTSLSAALEILGFGPCFHTYTLARAGKLDLSPWIKMAKEDCATTENLDKALGGYCSVLDQPPALFPEALYKAYPNAKFILTVRDPDEWERSMQRTMLPITRKRLDEEPKTQLEAAFKEWMHCKLAIWQPDMFTDTKAVLLRHNANIKSLIPPEKLLIFNVKQGWEPLVTFLEVEKPQVSFPHLNDSESFKHILL